jgi:hypothetical protein
VVHAWCAVEWAAGLIVDTSGRSRNESRSVSYCYKVVNLCKSSDFLVSVNLNLSIQKGWFRLSGTNTRFSDLL